VLAELTLDPPVSASDLAGPPRLDEDYLTISTIHAAKGLEWPIVHLPHLVDGAIPSDMALGDPGGLAEEHRLFYVAVTRARDHLYLYAPQRLHVHRRGRDDRHGFGQLTRFLDEGRWPPARASPPRRWRRCCPRSDPWPRRSTRPSAPSGTAERSKLT
jgi:Superfamily I DNA and RNA helicases